MKLKRFVVLLSACIFFVGCNSKNETKVLSQTTENEMESKNLIAEEEIDTVSDESDNLEIQNLSSDSNDDNNNPESDITELSLDKYVVVLEDFSKSLDENIQKNLTISYLNKYNRFFDHYFMKAVVDSGDYTVVEALMEIINAKADQKDDYDGTFSREGDPLTMAVYNNDISMVKFIAEKSPLLITLVHNGARGGCQDWQILDCAQNDEMISLLISLVANTEIDFGDNGWLGKDCIVYNTIEDAENGTGYIGPEGKSIWANGRFYVFNKKENKYIKLYRIEYFSENNSDYVYVPVFDVSIDPDL